MVAKRVEVAERRYSIEEVGEVIRTASALTRAEARALEPVLDTMSFSELRELAQEMGIDEAALLRAIPEAEKIRERAEKRAHRKLRFWRHLFTYLVVMGGFTLLDLLGRPGLSWSTLMIATFWGMGLTLHGVRVFLTGKGGRLHRRVLQRELEAERYRL